MTSIAGVSEASGNGGNSLEIGDGSEGNEGKESALESLPVEKERVRLQLIFLLGKLFQLQTQPAGTARLPSHPYDSSDITGSCLGVTKGFSDNCIGDPSDLHVASFPCLVPFV